MSKRILSNLCFVFKPNLLLVMELINVLANPSFLASNAVVQKMITCQVIFLKVPSPFPNSFWWRVSRWFSGANHLARPVITECQQCKMTQSLIHNGKNTLVLNPLKDFVIILIRHRRTPPSGSLTQTTGSVCRSARWNKKPSEMSWVIQLPFGFQSPPRC